MEFGIQSFYTCMWVSVDIVAYVHRFAEGKVCIPRETDAGASPAKHKRETAGRTSMYFEMF
jgi:hypothetical protein